MNRLTSDLERLNEQEKVLESFLVDVLRRNISAEEYLNAYYCVLGISQPSNGRVTTLVLQMKEVLGKNILEQHLLSGYDAVRECAGGAQTYTTYVNMLCISGKEKRVLKSIIDQNRSGTIYFLDGDKQRAKMSLVFEEDMEPNNNYFGLLLTRKIHTILESIEVNEQLSIQFEET